MLEWIPCLISACSSPAHDEGTEVMDRCEVHSPCVSDEGACVCVCAESCFDTPQGEMSATVVYFPGSYVKLLPDLRQRLSAGQASSSNIKLGVSTNFDKLCGCVLQVSQALTGTQRSGSSD